MRAAGINPVDWKMLQGFMREVIPLALPAGLGSDVSGVVSQVAVGVTEFQLGDQVLGSSLTPSSSEKTKKLTVALSAATAIAAATVGLASPALASPSAVGSGLAVVSASGANIATNPATAVAFDPGMLPQCSVQVNHNGTNVNVVWC